VTPRKVHWQSLVSAIYAGMTILQPAAWMSLRM